MKKQALSTMAFPFLLLIASLLGGCVSSAPLSSLKTDPVKNLQPNEEQALVYLVRHSKLGFAVRMKVYANGEYLGATNGRRFIYAYLEPGDYLILSKSENKAELPITLKGGKTYYIEQNVNPGLLYARSKLERVSETEGRNLLARCKLFQ